MQDNMDWELNTSLCTAVSFPQTNEGGAVNDLRKSVWIKKNIHLQLHGEEDSNSK